MALTITPEESERDAILNLVRRSMDIADRDIAEILGSIRTLTGRVRDLEAIVRKMELKFYGPELSRRIASGQREHENR